MTEPYLPTLPGQPYGTANDENSFLLGGLIERVYYTVPGNHYGVGPEFNTRPEAMEFARQELKKIQLGEKGEFAKAEVDVVTRLRVVGAGSTHDFQIETLTLKP